MIWVLVVVGYLGGYVGGYSSTTFQEFTSKVACEAAVTEITAYAKGSSYIHPFCTAK